MAIDLEMAKQLLSTCVKYENRDHAFGDVEIEWYNKDNNVGSGYFGRGGAEVHVTDFSASEERRITGSFTGNAARVLRKCFATEHIDRNDETGPDNFDEGHIMPGLTKEGVFEELTRPPD